MKENSMDIEETQFDWILRKEQILLDKQKKIEEAILKEEAKKQQKYDKKRPQNKRMEMLA
jgi:hypothetical protein